jgi:hypothetical protein
MNTDMSASNYKHLPPTLPLKNEGTLDECLLYYFPDLSEKELIVCGMIVNEYCDEFRGSYGAVAEATATYHKIFQDEKEAEAILDELIKKGVVIATLLKGGLYEVSLAYDLQNSLACGLRSGRILDEHYPF